MVQARPNKNSREQWLATNKTKRELAISDVLSIPAIRPGKTLDLLRYATREQLSYSKILPLLVKKGMVSLVKKHTASGETEIVDSSSVDKALIPTQYDDSYDYGDGGGGGGSSNLAELEDIDVTGLADGQLLRYNIVSGKWEPVDMSSIGDMSDIDLTGLSDDQVLQYDLASEKWKPIDLSVLGGYGSSDFDADFATKTIDDLDGISITGDDLPDEGDVLTYVGGSVDSWVPVPKSRIPVTIIYNLDSTIDFITFDTGETMNFGYDIEGTLLTITEGSIVKTLQYNAEGLVSGIVVS